MSSPDVNLEKQKSRHRGPLVGIAASLIVAGALFAAFVVWSSDEIGEKPAAAVSATD